jgi:hypothetical protein
LQDLESEAVINAILDLESPQLVVLNGDLITGENTFLANSTSYVDKIVRPLVQRDLLWASTYGNHDSDYNLSRDLIYAKEKTYANSLTQNMVSDTLAGVSNYYLEVFSNDTTKTTPELIIWFFDSRGGNYYQQLSSAGIPVPQPNWVDASVVSWFTATNAKLQTAATVIPSIAFVHIPVNAMLAFQSASYSSTKEPGINADVPLSQQGVAQGQGTVTGTVFSYSGQDIPFMQALLNTPGLMSVHSGHDHGDDWFVVRILSKNLGLIRTGASSGIQNCQE